MKIKTEQQLYDNFRMKFYFVNILHPFEVGIFINKISFDFINHGSINIAIKLNASNTNERMNVKREAHRSNLEKEIRWSMQVDKIKRKQRKMCNNK